MFCAPHSPIPMCIKEIWVSKKEKEKKDYSLNPIRRKKNVYLLLFSLNDLPQYLNSVLTLNGSREAKNNVLF